QAAFNLRHVSDTRTFDFPKLLRTELLQKKTEAANADAAHRLRLNNQISLCKKWQIGSALAGLACAALAWKFRRSRPKTAVLFAGLGIGFGCFWNLFRQGKNYSNILKQCYLART